MAEVKNVTPSDSDANMSKVAAPEGFRVVTKDEFFAALYADPRDIMPCIQHSPYYTTWETKSRVVWGWSAPGWKNPRDEAIFALAP